MFVSMRDRPGRCARRAALLGLAVVASFDLAACRSPLARPRTPPPQAVVLAAKKTKSPKHDKTVRGIGKPELDAYLHTGKPTERPARFRDGFLDFADGIANRRDVAPATGGGTVSVVIAPEEGNFLLSTDPASGDFPAQQGVVVARIFNEGNRADAVTNTPPGELSYWFVERGPPDASGNPGRLRSLIIRDSDGSLLKEMSFAVCHRRPGTYPAWWIAAADFIDPVDCEPLPPGRPPEETLQFGSSLMRGGASLLQSRSGTWIPCAEGCCVGR